MRRNNEFLGTEKISTLLWEFAIPSIVAMLVSALYNIVDQFFIGHAVGSDGNAATSVAFPLNTCCTALALLMGIGGSAIFNILMGKGDRKKATFHYGNSVSMLAIFGVILCTVTLFFMDPLLKLFGASDSAIFAYAKEYTTVTAFGFPFLILSIGGGHLIRADGSPRIAMICNLTGAVINTILDAIFVFGFNLGMTGAALATVIGQFVAAMIVINYLRNCKSIKLEKQHLIIRLRYVAKNIALGFGPFSNQIAMLVVQVVLNNSLTHYGKMSAYGGSIPLAVVGIITKVNMLYMSIVIGLSQGMQPIASYNYGARNIDRVKAVYKLVLKCGFVVSMIAFAMFQIFPRTIIGAFGSGSKEYFDFAEMYFRVYLFFTCINFFQVASSTFFTAVGMPIKGAFISLTRQTLFLVPLLLILPFIMGIDGIMYAGPIADLAAAIVTVIMIKYTLDKMTKRMALENGS